MAEPTTSNLGLIIPSTGDLVGQWGPLALNPDFAAIDGLLGAVTTIGLSSSNVTLTSSGASITPAPGPYQANTAILRCTGAISTNLTVTLPLPGIITIENLTTGPYTVSFAAASAGQVISTPQGSIVNVYNDGTNVRFVSGIADTPGKQEFWAGLSAIPSWVTACTVQPYLVCDGTVYNFSTYPYLGARLGGNFGGNGITTFGVPDLRGRVPLAYDGTGSRITPGISGIYGQTLGSAADNQGITLSSGQIPTITVAGSNNIVVTPTGSSYYGIPVTITPANVSGASVAAGSNVVVPASSGASWAGVPSLSGYNSINATSNNTGGGVHSNVQPSQVAGIWVIKAA